MGAGGQKQLATQCPGNGHRADTGCTVRSCPSPSQAAVARGPIEPVLKRQQEPGCRWCSPTEGTDHNICSLYVRPKWMVVVLSELLTREVNRAGCTHVFGIKVIICSSLVPSTACMAAQTYLINAIIAVYPDD